MGLATSLCFATKQINTGCFFQSKGWKTRVIWIQTLLRGYTRVVQPHDLLLAVALDTCSSLQGIFARASFQHCRLVSLGEYTQQRKRWFRAGMCLWLSHLLEERHSYAPRETGFLCLDFTAVRAPQASCTVSLHPYHLVPKLLTPLLPPVFASSIDLNSPLIHPFQHLNSSVPLSPCSSQLQSPPLASICLPVFPS